jgi:hypothetical protein
MDEPGRPSVGGSRPDDAARDYIAGRMKAGTSREAIVQELIQRGYEPAMAKDLVGGGARKQASSACKSALIYLIVGIVITLLAIGTSISSYNTAEQGGTYVICWGAALFGLYLTIRSLLQLVRGREVK